MLYSAVACRWFDRANGNTYHSVRITRCEDGAEIRCGMRYGYGDHYRQTALCAMAAAGWLPEKYTNENACYFERENAYPVWWDVRDTTKQEMVFNGKEGK